MGGLGGKVKGQCISLRFASAKKHLVQVVACGVGVGALGFDVHWRTCDMCILRRTCASLGGHVTCASLGGHVRAGHPNEGELEWANGRVSPEPKQLRVGRLLAADCWPLAAGCSTCMPLMCQLYFAFPLGQGSIQQSARLNPTGAKRQRGKNRS